MRTMRAIAAKINTPALHRYMLMIVSLILGIVTCAFVG